MDDSYLANGPVYAAAGSSYWAAASPVLSRFLAVRDDPGVVVDIGSGAGLALLTLAGCRPLAEIVAVEPSEIMRAALMATVHAHGLQQRTTVIEGGIASLLERGWTDSWQVVLAVSMLGHLDAGAMQSMLEVIGQRLHVDGVAIVGLQPPYEVKAMPRESFGAVHVGRLRYESSGECAPDGAEHVLWRMSWDCYDGDALLVSRAGSFRWRVVGRDQLADSAHQAGLDCSLIDDQLGLFALTRR